MVVGTQSTNTTCPYCGVGCGVQAEHSDDRLIAVSGDKLHPANAGALCVKGTHLPHVTASSDRLLYPSVDGVRVSSAKASKAIADRFLAIRQQHGPESIAFYLSGQLLTEDYYVANKLMKGFLGSGNVDTNSRLCMASAVAAHKQSFGEDVVACEYADLDHASLIVLVGSNAAYAHPVLFARMLANQAAGTKIVSIDPRATTTSKAADIHLPIRPGSDLVLFNGLLAFLAANNHLDQTFVSDHTTGFEAAIDSVPTSTREVALACGIGHQQLIDFFELYAEHEATVTAFSQGVNQSQQGTKTASAIINCHLATGRIGKRGMGPFSITGQPNAMGGREVGGMANQLAAHRGFSESERAEVAAFWGAEDMASKPGLLATDLFDAVDRGKVKAIWIMATNPAASLPDSDRVSAALEQCELVVVSDCVQSNDTLRHANVILPAAAWSEKDGTVTNSERTISRQRAFLPAPGEAQADWAWVCQVAQDMGFTEAFNYFGSHEIFAEHVALTKLNPTNTRLLNLGHLPVDGKKAYDALMPQRWPKQKPFADGYFPTRDGRARFVPTPALTKQKSALNTWVLNSGRERDQWHTMTRTGQVPRLSGQAPFPRVVLNPDDGKNGELMRVKSPVGELNAVCETSAEIRVGEAFMPIHWSRQNSSAGNVSRLYERVVDPISGQPNSKQVAVGLDLINVNHWARLYSKARIPRSELDKLDYWACSIANDGYWYEVALDQSSVPKSWRDKRATCRKFETNDLRTELFSRDREVSMAVWISTSLTNLPLRVPEPVISDWSLLAPASTIACSKLVCACFGVTEAEIDSAIRSGESLQEIQASLKCGTNCGTCLPELRARLDNHQTQASEKQHVAQL